MQITRSQPVSLGVLLFESDLTSLSPGFIPSSNKRHLLDLTLGAKHDVHASARPILELLKRGATAGELATSADARGLGSAKLTSLLTALADMGALEVKRPLSGAVSAASTYCQGLILGARFVAPAWRRPVSAGQLLLGIVRASWLVIGAGALVAALFAFSGMAAPGVTARFTFFTAATFISSVYVHELAHLAVIRRTGAPAVLLQRGLRLGIIHQALPPQQEIVAALAGPLLGLVSSTLASVLAWRPAAPEMAVAALIVASFHLFSLLPGYGDGRSLSRALQTLTSTARA